MGYSCTKAANVSLDNLVKQLKASSQIEHDPSNTWDKNGTSHFHEIGQEQPDGAITGTVERFVGENRCRTAGSFRIEPDGTVTRFPTSTKAQRDAAYNAAQKRFLLKS